MWVAELGDGSMVGGPGANFLNIDQPILKLGILNIGITIKDCSQYYMVFHAIAAVGKQGRVEAIEIGGLHRDGKFHGINVARDGKKERKTYTKELFPYHTALKLGITID